MKTTHGPDAGIEELRQEIREQQNLLTYIDNPQQRLLNAQYIQGRRIELLKREALAKIHEEVSAA